MFFLTRDATLDRNIKSVLIIALILIVRKKLNRQASKRANLFLWSLLIIFLLFPYNISISVDQDIQHGLFQPLISFMLGLTQMLRFLNLGLGSFFSENNRRIVTICLVAYFIIKVYKRNTVMREAKRIELDQRIHEILQEFHLRREIEVYAHDQVPTSITFGIFRPKIILESSVLQDDFLLKDVLEHELMHIKHFHMVFIHLINITVCLYWYNFAFWLAARLIIQDLEVACDKLVIEHRGNTLANRRNYCLSMLHILEKQKESSYLSLSFNPTMERMRIMRYWKKSISGMITLVLVLILSSITIFDVHAKEKDPVAVEYGTSHEIENPKISVDDRVRELTDEEYLSLDLKEVQLKNVLRSADINHTVTLQGLDSNRYNFDMSSQSESTHNRFTVRTSNMSSRGGVEYELVVVEGEDIIFSKVYTSSIQLTVKANYKGRYTVLIRNRSAKSLTYTMNIHSYVKR